MTAADIGQLIQETCADMELLLKDKSIRLQQEVQTALPAVLVDQRWLKRALTNYLDNAAKYTDEGDTIVVRAFANEAILHIEVIDHGPGIPIEAQSRLFERFYRVADTEKIRGTGLGLAIVKSVAEAHGGGVYVRSTKGLGSTFGLTIRLRQPQPAAPANP
jgi:signal transduction histidine kinase